MRLRGCAALGMLAGTSACSLLFSEAFDTEAWTRGDAIADGGDRDVGLAPIDATVEAAIADAAPDPCATACADGLVCTQGICGPPTSCRELLAARPGTPSGPRLIDSDGAGPEPSLAVFCDMTTAGGGFTIVFTSKGENEDTKELGYTSATPALLQGATETLLAYRRADFSTETTALFDLPPEWKAKAPFTYERVDVQVAVSLDGAAKAITTLRYGYRNWNSDFCEGAWKDDTSDFGRICLLGTSSIYFAGFADDDPEHCNKSNEAFNVTPCTPSHMFTIAVR